MNDELSRTRQKISQLGLARNALETKVMKTGDVLKASYYERFIVCGKPNCKCAQGEKHGPVPWVTARKGKETVSTSVPAENVAEVKEMTQNYKDFRDAQKEIKKINKEIDRLIQDILQMKERGINEALKRQQEEKAE
jgi:hypothetical protein